MMHIRPSTLTVAAVALSFSFLLACEGRPPAQQGGAPAAAKPAAPAPVVEAKGKYSAKFADGIDFKRVGLPSFVDAKGLSDHEAWGRWTDGDKLTLTFKDPLPKDFTLIIKAGRFGPNTEAFKFNVGKASVSQVIEADQQTMAPYTLKFSGAEGNVLEILVPKATSPGAHDPRRLGLAIETINFQ